MSWPLWVSAVLALEFEWCIKYWYPPGDLLPGPLVQVLGTLGCWVLLQRFRVLSLLWRIVGQLDHTAPGLTPLSLVSGVDITLGGVQAKRIY